MKSLKEYIIEAEKIDFNKIDFYDFCDLLEDKAYDIGDWSGRVSAKVIYIKSIFNKESISCNVTGLSNTNEILKKLYPHTSSNAQFIYVDRTGPRTIGVYGVGRFKGFMYMKSMSDLIECFGEKNLSEIYNFIS